MIYNLIHITRFDFDEVQNNVLQKVRLFPSNYKFQRIIKWDIKSDDADKELVSKDYHGNTIQLFRKVSDKFFIEIQSTGEVEVIDNDGIVDVHDLDPVDPKKWMVMPSVFRKNSSDSNTPLDELE